MIYATETTLLGRPFFLMKTEKGLQKTWFDHRPYDLAVKEEKALVTATPFEEEMAWLKAYEERRTLPLPPLDLVGTEFQTSVWALTAEIAFGQVLTYGQVAKGLQRPKASRACGGALGKNPLPIFIPCHRVVASSGALTGFSAEEGTLLKKRLLTHENVPMKGEMVLVHP